jgi:hypothetical protein
MECVEHVAGLSPNQRRDPVRGLEPSPVIAHGAIS